MFGMRRRAVQTSDQPGTERGFIGEDTPAGVLANHARGRGAQLNPTNRYERVSLHINGEAIDEAHADSPDGMQHRTEVFADHTRTIINRVDSPDISFSWTINPYRGCEHGCIYCYARPTHEQLGFSCGLDFESKILAKMDAPELLRRELASPKWIGEPIVLSGVTDPYQPIERRLRITRGILELCAEARQPLSFVTKNRLVLRDLDLLRRLNEHRAVRVAVSVTTLDARLSQKMEPRATRPADRLRTIETLSNAGIPVVAMVAPVIPGLTDTEIPAILKSVADAGAHGASWVMLRLPHQVKVLFLDWLKREYPERSGRIEANIRGMRGGKLYDATPGKRARGEGHLATQIRSTFKVFQKRYELYGDPPPLNSDAFRRPALDGQMSLFDVDSD